MPPLSLTIDSMNAGGMYGVFTEQTFGTYNKAIASGYFVDQFEGLFLLDRQLYANFRKQGAIDCRVISRIEVVK